MRTPSLDSGAYVTDNTASQYGGGMTIISTSITNFGDNSYFARNKAGASHDGGSVYITGSTVIFGKNTAMTSSTAYQGGCLAVETASTYATFGS